MINISVMYTITIQEYNKRKYRLKDIVSNIHFWMLL